MEDYWGETIINHHYYIKQDDIINTNIKDKFDCITCISVLEHIRESNQAIKNCAKLLKDKGYLLLTFPYKEDKYIGNAYELENSNIKDKPDYICQMYARSNIEEWINENNLKIISQEYYKVFAGDYWEQGEKLFPQIETNARESHHLTCIVLQKN